MRPRVSRGRRNLRRRIHARARAMSESSVKHVHVPPQTRREDFSETIHGQEVPDPYRWLEDGASAETRAWVAAQTEYATPFLATPERARLRARLTEIMKVNEV